MNLESRLRRLRRAFGHRRRPKVMLYVGRDGPTVDAYLSTIVCHMPDPPYRLTEALTGLTPVFPLSFDHDTGIAGGDYMGGPDPSAIPPDEAAELRDLVIGSAADDEQRATLDDARWIVVMTRPSSC